MKVKAYLLLAFFVLLPLLIFPQLQLRPDIQIPSLTDFRPLPSADPEFDKVIAECVRKAGLDLFVSPEENPDKQTEHCSICVVELLDPEKPRVGGWHADQMTYPASAYKLYVLGELVRQILSGEHNLDEVIEIKAHNVREPSIPEGDQRPGIQAGEKMRLRELMLLMMDRSDNTAANVCIDVADRQRISALIRAMGLKGSDITRKFLPRTLEDDGYSTVPGTTSTALHFATFLWAVEQGAIGGGKGRELIKSFMSFCYGDRVKCGPGLPPSASWYHKTGTFSIWAADVGIVEDGRTRYILCLMCPLRKKVDDLDERMANFTRLVHSYLQDRASKQ